MSKSPTQVTDDERARIISDYLAGGWTTRSLSAKYGRSSSTISRIIQAAPSTAEKATGAQCVAPSWTRPCIPGVRAHAECKPA